jgi:hypothetical protein
LCLTSANILIYDTRNVNNALFRELWAIYHNNYSIKVCKYWSNMNREARYNGAFQALIYGDGISHTDEYKLHIKLGKSTTVTGDTR